MTEWYPELGTTRQYLGCAQCCSPKPVFEYFIDGVSVSNEIFDDMVKQWASPDPFSPAAGVVS